MVKTVTISKIFVQEGVRSFSSLGYLVFFFVAGMGSIKPSGGPFVSKSSKESSVKVNFGNSPSIN